MDGKIVFVDGDFIMGLYEGRGTLAKSIKQLENRWLDARVSWDDQRSREFEERFILPLQVQLRDAISAMDTMATLINRIHGECE